MSYNPNITDFPIVPNLLTFVAGPTISATSVSIAFTAADTIFNGNIRIGSGAGPQLVGTGPALSLGGSSFTLGTGGGPVPLYFRNGSGGNIGVAIGNLAPDHIYANIDINAPSINSTSTITAPSYAFTGSTSTLSATGIDISVSDHLRIGGPGGAQLSDDGVNLVLANRAFRIGLGGATISNSGTTAIFNGSIYVPIGTNSDPSISTPTDTNTGVKFTGGDVLELIAGGSSKLLASPTQVAITNAQLRVDDGTALLPSYSWSTQTNMGLLKTISNQMAASIAGEIITYWGFNYFGVEKSYIGANLLNYVKNTDNTNGLSNAYLEAVSGGPSGGDAAAHFVINGITDWVIGIDNSQSDRFAIGQSNLLGTNDFFFITTGGDATFLGTNVTVPNLLTFAGGTFFTANSTEIAVSNHLRVGGLGGAQLADDGTNLVLANRFFRIGLGGATLSNNGTDLVLGAGLSLSGQTGTNITSTATDIALNGNIRVGSPGGPQLGNTSGDLFLAAGANLRLLAQTANTAVVFDAAKRLVSSTTTATEIGFLSGVTSNVQSQLSGAAQNFLLNSNFDLWQNTTASGVGNGAIPNGTSTYGPDQWYVKNSLGTNGAITMSRVTGTSDGATYALKVLITTAPTAAQANGTELYQVIENRDSFFLKNQTASFSIKVKAFGNVNQVGVQFYYATTQTKLTTAIGSEVTATVNTSTFTTITIDSQALGNSMTAAGVVGVRIRITGVSTGNTYDLNNGYSVEQAMLNLGAPATYRRQGKTYADEIQACQRFFEKSFNIDMNIGADSTSGFSHTVAGRTNTGNWLTDRYQVRKAATAPTVTIYSISDGATGNVRNTSGGTNVAATTTNGDSGHVVSFAGSDQNVYSWHWVSDSRI